MRVAALTSKLTLLLIYSVSFWQNLLRLLSASFNKTCLCVCACQHMVTSFCSSHDGRAIITSKLSLSVYFIVTYPISNYNIINYYIMLPYSNRLTFCDYVTLIQLFMKSLRGTDYSKLGNNFNGENKMQMLRKLEASLLQ